MAKQLDVYIGIPTYDGKLGYHTHLSLSRALEHCAKVGMTVQYSVMPPCSILTLARDRCAEKAIERKSRYLVMIDTDMVFAEDAVHRLVSKGKDVIGGLYVKKIFPHSLVAADVDEDGTYIPLEFNSPNEITGIRKVGGVGFGLVAIRTGLLHQLKKPYFPFTYTDDGGTIGEDYSFCQRVIKMGYDVYVDLDLRLGHCGHKMYTLADYGEAKMREQMAAIEKAESENRIIKPNSGLVVPS